MVRPPSQRQHPIPTPVPHRMCHPIIPTTRRYQRIDILFQHIILEVLGIQRSSLCTYVRVPANVVLRREFHPVDANRSHRSTSLTSEHDFRHGGRDGRTNRPDLQCTKLHIDREILRYRGRSHVIYFRRRVYYRVCPLSLFPIPARHPTNLTRTHPPVSRPQSGYTPQKSCPSNSDNAAPASAQPATGSSTT